MILDSSLEVKLYTKESVELPNILKDRLPRIQFISQPENIDDIQEMFSYSIKNKLSIIPGAQPLMEWVVLLRSDDR